jgi:hypothetical protein
MQRVVEINDPKLEQARREFEAWRSQRPRPRQMPERLWHAAVALARRHGVDRIARDLGLNPTRLRAHLDAAPSSALHKVTPSPAFVELSPSPTAAARSECTIQIERIGGERLTMRFAGEHVADFAAAFGRAFVGPAGA